MESRVTNAIWLLIATVFYGELAIMLGTKYEKSEISETI
jgi:hypothetical protein